MHYSLIREYLSDELGGDPEDIFASFEKTAFAAASLGQVHRAQLKSGEDVAVKIQYPGIANTIRADMRNLQALLFPLRLTKDWDNLRDQLTEIRETFLAETDYEVEARSLTTARGVFAPEEGILVPRVYQEHSTSRVLTMEYIGGRSFYDFLATRPSQELRDQFGTKIYRANSALLNRASLHYADVHQGNYLFLEDGRLGCVDFGCMRTVDDAQWKLLDRMAEVVVGGRWWSRRTAGIRAPGVPHEPRRSGRQRRIRRSCRRRLPVELGAVELRR
jgi:aarF domain-containing kinase